MPGVRERTLDRRTFVTIAAGLGAAALLEGCSDIGGSDGVEAPLTGGDGGDDAGDSDGIPRVVPASEVRELEDGFSCVRFEGDDRLGAFLDQGGAASDAEVLSFLMGGSGFPRAGVSFLDGTFGCSTLEACTSEGEALFGRNFDWRPCHARVIAAHPDGAYASLSTVNMDFLDSYGDALDGLSDEVRSLVALYAPLDGMNERGLAVAVLMIQDGATVMQDTGRTGLTTTTAVRVLLDRAGTVQEAVDVLAGCDMHASRGLMVHFAIADASGSSVAVEYIDNRMTVVDTPVVTNFYLAEGDRHGRGTPQSHDRYEILSERLAASDSFSLDDVRDALEAVGKHNYRDGETTEWSMVCNQATGEVRYYHREDYGQGYRFMIGGSSDEQ